VGNPHRTLPKKTQIEELKILSRMMSKLYLRFATCFSDDIDFPLRPHFGPNIQLSSHANRITGLMCGLSDLQHIGMFFASLSLVSAAYW
jgi:hypothetical protein